MSGRESFQAAASRFRNAVATGAYAEATARLAELRAAIEAAPTEELAREAGALLEWARRMALAARADAALQLPRLRPRYRVPARRRSAVRLMA